MALSNCTYVPYVPDSMIKSVGMLEAIMACKIPLFADKETGKISVSFALLSELWGIDKRTLKKAADKLQLMQILYYKTSQGRGIITEWKKGANYDTFMSIEKVHILHKKGTQNVPINKDTIKNKRAYARDNFKFNNAGETPAPPKKGKRLTRDQYYTMFGDDIVRPGWKFYKPEGYERFIYEKL